MIDVILNRAFRNAFSQSPGNNEFKTKNAKVAITKVVTKNVLICVSEKIARLFPLTNCTYLTKGRAAIIIKTIATYSTASEN